MQEGDINGSAIRAVTVCVALDESMTTTGVHQGRIQATVRGAGNDCECEGSGPDEKKTKVPITVANIGGRKEERGGMSWR